jgi:conjugative transfer pilus assembly protein TraH
MPFFSTARIKLVSFALLVAMLSNPLTVFAADIAGSLDQMWYASAGGTVNGSNGMGVYGPSFSVRSPNKTYQIAYFDPPRFSAGCSGIDATLGSFSLLTLNQIGDMVRKIMQAAPAFLLKLAIKAMCEDCFSVMEGLQHLAQQINNMNINACKISQSLFNAMEKDVKNDTGENTKAAFETMVSMAKSKVSDIADGFTKLFSGGDKANRADAAENSSDYYNTVFNTIYTTGANNKLNTDIFGGEQTTMEILQSIIGTSVKPVASGDQTSSDKSDPDYPATLTFADLVNGQNKARKVTYLSCGDFVADINGCQSIKHDKEFTYQGVRRYLISKLAGDQGSDDDGEMPDGISKIDENSIIGKIQSGNIDGLTDAEKAIVNELPVNMKTIVILLNKTSSASKLALYNVAANIMADELTAAAANSLINAIRTAYSTNRMNKASGDRGGKNIVTLTQAQKRRLDEFEKDALKAQNIEERMERLNKLMDAVAKTRALSA